jgi:DNA polymerase III delta subunit
VRRGETSSDWCHAVLEDRSGEAARMLDHLLDQPGVSAVGLLTMLGTNLIGLGMARAQYDKGLRGNSLERAVFEGIRRARPARIEWSDAARRWSGVIDAWPIGRIDAAIAAACRADRRIKDVSLADDRGILLDLVMQLAHCARGDL